MRADAKTQAGVMAAIKTYVAAHKKRDLDATMACFTQDPDMVNFGSGPDEKLVGVKALKKQFLRDWSQSDAGDLKLKGARVSAAGKVAWVTGDASYVAKVKGKTLEMNGRLVLILEKRKGKWLIAHLTFFMPFGGQGKGQSFPKA